MIFASLELEREPPALADVPAMFGTWFQDVGIIAALAIVICTASFFAERRTSGGKRLSLMWTLFFALGGVAALGYVAFLGLLLNEGLIRVPIKVGVGEVETFKMTDTQQLALSVSGFFAMMAALVPMIVGVFGRIAWTRIWAIARLTIKESIRNRVVFIFGIMGLLFLFYGFFSVTYKPEDQIRNYISTIYTAMVILFLVMAVLLGSFSIPVDVTRQTIHTIVTKPVERYEVVLGRFIGHGLLLTVVLAVLSLISLLYVYRDVNAAAARESFTARVSIFADELSFYGTSKSTRGENVGREWDYRSYIRGRLPGSNELQQYAIWHFSADKLAPLAQRERPIRVEYYFDIFRTNKGKLDQGVRCTFYASDGRHEVYQLEENLKKLNRDFNKERSKIDDKFKGKPAATAKERQEIASQQLAETERIRERLFKKYGVYVLPTQEVTDYHTAQFTMPAALFAHAQTIGEEIAKKTYEGKPPPAMKILVRVENDRYSRQQLLGVAARDVYILAAELPFWQNFLKGMVGLWCNTMLVLGIAVACSTYFSGIISLFCALFFLGLGFLGDFLRSLALGIVPGGGPLEAANRVFSRMSPAAPMDQTTTTAVMGGIDKGYQLYLNFMMRYIPDFQHFNLTEYIEEGFDISWVNVLLLDNVLPMLAFLIPWAVLSYYLMNSREIANPR